MKLSEELAWRGLIKDTTFADHSWLDEPKTFYLGADVGSADSLTIGNLAVFLLARRLLEAGWQTVLLVGGATSLIGDPGGKDSERELVSRETVEHNKTAIAEQVRNLFADKPFTLVDNYDWFKDIGYLEFLRDVGKQYSMTELVQRDFIASRLGEGASGISYAEFSYSLIQGYDFWHLFKHHGVVLQIGGSDQWGNMLSGVPLIRKKENAEAHAMSMPLVINKASGKKFGKSEDGAVWLDAKLTSPYKFYQFWLNVDDEGVEDYLKIYTMLDKAKIEQVMSDFSQNKSARNAQKTLAWEVTKLVHGEEQANKIVRITDVLFGSQPFQELANDEIDMLKAELPVVQAGQDLPQVLVDGGLAASKTEARNFISGGAVSINGTKVDESSNLDVLSNGANLVRRGKNNFAIADKR